MPRSPALTRLAALLVALALAGCRGGTTPASSDEAGTSAEAAATAAQEPTAAQTEEGNASDDESARTRPLASASPETASAQPTEKCATMTGAEAISTWGPQVPTFRSESYWQWDLDGADTTTYDACAALSWVVLEIPGNTASSPFQIMLFHRGQYIGTTASKPIGFPPKVVRLDDAAIQVAYTWPRDGESNAEASGRSISIFTWDDRTRSVTHSGEWPPGFTE
ncbi:LppP/LprE family lipoprotein [Actinomyces dentalis]|uniref:LppP/LprE family lipoprotein n=1 Tax=Actinomyces dentalis TaxID=272548 RepID=UPI00235666A7|nr:LppP/LprE family lipoprotein [Actinomyces dentalis]